jgi:hypothetical protein
MIRTQYYLYLLSLSLLLASCANKHYKRTSSLTTSDLCSVVNKIVKNLEIAKTLALNEVPQYSRSSIRIFTPGVALDSCRSIVGAWRVQYLDKLRPSLNTGYHRDIVIYERSDINPTEYHVYLSSHKNYENRQTNYLLRFVGTNSDSLSLIGFAEYTEE